MHTDAAEQRFRRSRDFWSAAIHRRFCDHTRVNLFFLLVVLCHGLRRLFPPY